MIVVTTGMVGIDKKAYLEQVVELCKSRGKNVELYNVGEMMYREAPDIPKGRILDISLKRLGQIRRSVFKDVIAKSKNVDNLIVNTHATFRWRHGLFPAVDFDQLRELDADLYVCIVDGVDALHVRLIREHPIRHSLKDLIVWREEELLGTEMVRNGIDESLPCFCLARGFESETVETYYQLMFENYRRKTYLSFPMTHVMSMPDVQKRIMKFRDMMKEHFICFDPGDLEEMYLPFYAEKAQKQGQDNVTIKALDTEVEVPLSELQQIDRDIKAQVYARDFYLIDQSDMIISFIPENQTGGPAISSGVERELQHAHEGAKEVYVIWTAKASPSVFVTQTANKVFYSEEEAMEYFGRKGYLNT